MTYCPLCHEPCEQVIHAGFIFCPSCDIAVRIKQTIPPEREGSYPDNWVETHSTHRNVATKVNYVSDLVKRLLPTRTGRILDVGCASGVLVDKLSAMGYEADGIDWSKSAVAFASNNMAGTFIVGDADLSVIRGEKVYDMIIASHIVEHLEDPRNLFSSAVRLLRQNSYLCVVVPNLAWYSDRPAWRNISSIFDPDHVAGYSPRSLISLLSRAGFETVDVITRTHDTDLLASFCSAVYGKITHNGEKPAKHTAGNPPVGIGVARRVYEGIARLPIMPLIMFLPNRSSEKNYRGMELIIVARPKRGWSLPWNRK